MLNSTKLATLSVAISMIFGCSILTSCGGGEDDVEGGGSGSGTSGGDTSKTELPTNTKARDLAFPGAEGSASTITGGAAGTSVYIVKNLDDSGTGSFRDAVSVSGRTIVFAVSGTINLEKSLTITTSNLTIAGQTAPGDGICLAGYPVKISGSSNVIVRYMRFRLGNQNIDKSNFDADNGDGLEVKDCKNIMIDHCSISWSTDECASFSRVENLTVQYCIISESLKLAGHSKGNHGYGGIWGGVNATYSHNLLADHDSRNPRFDHQYVASTYMGTIDYVNNVVYNWGGNSTYGGEGCDYAFHINMVNNYYKPGNNSTSHPNRLLDMTNSCSNCLGKAEKATSVHPGYFYLSGNTVNGTANKDWSGVDNAPSDYASYKLSERYTTGLSPYIAKPETAEEAFNNVLAFAGASYKRDAVDTRIVNQVKDNTGAIIDNVDETPGYPTLNSTSALTDADKDGMPDAWEEEQIKALGVSGKTYKDFTPFAYTLSAKYTNLEVYMNELVSGTFPSKANATVTR